jgi:hypothetical protein
LDESLLCGGAKGEWQVAFLGVLEDAEHGVSSLLQVVVRGDVWKGDCVGEPVDGENIPALRSGWNVAFVAAVMVEGWTHIPAVNTMGSHIGLLGWSDVGNDLGARQGEGCV